MRERQTKTQMTIVGILVVPPFLYSTQTCRPCLELLSTMEEGKRTRCDSLCTLDTLPTCPHPLLFASIQSLHRSAPGHPHPVAAGRLDFIEWKHGLFVNGAAYTARVARDKSSLWGPREVPPALFAPWKAALPGLVWTRSSASPRVHNPLLAASSQTAFTAVFSWRAPCVLERRRSAELHAASLSPRWLRSQRRGKTFCDFFLSLSPAGLGF